MQYDFSKIFYVHYNNKIAFWRKCSKFGLAISIMFFSYDLNLIPHQQKYIQLEIPVQVQSLTHHIEN